MQVQEREIVRQFVSLLSIVLLVVTGFTAFFVGVLAVQVLATVL